MNENLCRNCEKDVYVDKPCKLREIACMDIITDCVEYEPMKLTKISLKSTRDLYGNLL